jgi:hypothetical protein
LVKPFLSENELKEFDERFKATQAIAGKLNLSSEIWRNQLALVEVFNTERLRESSLRLEESSLRLENITHRLEESSAVLEKKSQRLNCLTWALVGLTTILAILTTITVFKLF